MRDRHSFVTLLAILVFSGSPASAQSPERAQIRAEVGAALVEYVAAFSQGRADYIAESVYTAPAYFLGGNGVEVRMTTPEVQAHFERMLAPLAAQGYERSDIRTSDVCVLSDVAALVRLGFARVRTDQSVMLEGTAFYLYTRTAEGWRIVASIGSSGDGIDCED
ncbi:MAG TPA: hypothetical protein EYQ27_15895 [Gemmatimonadetes bacterium]|jgi:hypothetical protein|nr:hypothetical protein [Gemmatimonadota bacterium]